MRDGILKEWAGWLIVLLVILGHLFDVFGIVFGALGMIFGGLGPHFWGLGDFREHFRSRIRSHQWEPRPGESFWEVFGGPKVTKKHVFFEHRFFYEKTWFFENRAGALVKAIILKGQGRFRRSSKPTKTTKIMKKSSQKCMKKARSKNMKNHEKTEKHEKQGPLRNTAYTSKNWGFHQSRTDKTLKNTKKQGCDK